MDLHVDDDGFVRAPAALCYRTLTNLPAWGTWWPGGSVTPVDGLADAVALVLPDARRLPGRGGRSRLRAVAGEWRHDRGFRLALSGDLDGTAEFWLEPGWGGTVVHHVLLARTDRDDGAAVLQAYRWWLRQGLWALKDMLQAQERAAQGLPA